jgi:hypothetical protein
MHNLLQSDLTSSAPPPAFEIGWEPIPGSSQVFALDSRCDETLYTGTRGPGKTTTQLMRFARRVGIGYGSYWRGIIFGRSYQALTDLVAQSKRFFPKIYGTRVHFYESKGDYFWEWDTGEVLMFRQIVAVEEYNNKYHGQEFPYIGWNELTHWATSELYDIMMSCNRSSWTQAKDSPKKKDGSYALPPIPLEVFSTTNSEGNGHNWVKRRFIDVAPYGTVVEHETIVFDPASKKNVAVKRTQVTIFGSFRENIYLAKEYIANLTTACSKDENKYQSWLLGNWDIVSGGALDDLWKKNVHVIPRFKVPKSFRIDRSFDWGSTHPYSVGWWAEASGEELIFEDGKKWAPFPGSLIQIAEDYGSERDENNLPTNKGLKLGSSVVADRIKAVEITMMRQGVVHSQPWPGPADNQIRNVNDDDTDTIEAKMAKRGIRWTESDKSQGSRKMGLELIREMLYNSLHGEGPGLYFCQNCIGSISTIPILPRDERQPDDVDTDAEDHCYDMMRYRVLKNKVRIARKINFGFAI